METGEAASAAHPLNAAQLQRWWWPYVAPPVYRFTLVLILLSLIMGVASEIVYSLRDDQSWADFLAPRNLQNEFAIARLTNGEGSLFWIIAAHGYGDYDARNIVKFPLYPALTRAVSSLSQGVLGLPLSLWLIHSLMVYFGLAEAYRFWEGYQPGYGRRALFWLVVSPLMILNVWLFDFIEPAFLGLLWLSLSLERERRWAGSSTALLVLAMLQPSGILIAFFFGLRRGYRWLHHDIPVSAVCWALLPAVTWIAWVLLTSLWFKQPLAPYTYQIAWGHTVFRWPWERWFLFVRQAFTLKFWWYHAIISVALLWITLGYFVGGQAWFALSPVQRSQLGGLWALPLVSLIIVVLPFASSVPSVNRYALTTLLGIWPLLLPERWQMTGRFQRAEKVIWAVSFAESLVVCFVVITGLNAASGIGYLS